MKQVQLHNSVIGIASIIIISVAIVGCSTSLNNDIFAKFKEETSSKNGWLYTIGDRYWITKDSINANYEFILKWVFNPSEYENNKKNGKLKLVFFEKMLNQNLIIAQAINDGLLDNDEFENYVWMAIKDAIVQYYLRKRIAAENPEIFILPSDDPEVDRQVEKLKNIYASSGLGDETLAGLKSKIQSEFIAGKLSHYENRIINELKLKNQIRFSK